MDTKEINRKTCLYCAAWQPERKTRKVIRHGGHCNISGDDTRMSATCWGWKELTPEQKEDRIRRGLISEKETLEKEKSPDKRD